MKKITWRVKDGSTHEIPENATLKVEGRKDMIKVWIDPDNNVRFTYYEKSGNAYIAKTSEPAR